MAILSGITYQITSGDALALGLYKAMDTCKQLGIEEAKVKTVVAQYHAFAENLRRRNPFSF